MPESLRSIQVFVAAYEERSFTAAAREHATQSGVSQHVRKLEERLGAKLFSRDRGRRADAAGEAYYERQSSCYASPARPITRSAGFAGADGRARGGAHANDDAPRSRCRVSPTSSRMS